MEGVEECSERSLAIRSLRSPTFSVCGSVQDRSAENIMRKTKQSDDGTKFTRSYGRAVEEEKTADIDRIKGLIAIRYEKNAQSLARQLVASVEG